MTTAILGILAALIPFAIWLWKRHAATEDDPWQQHENHRETIAKEIIHNDEAAANQSLDADLDKLYVLHSIRCEGGRTPDEESQ
jgi:hypothetical protein